ncbi:acyl-CoA dehydrogenase/oxidase [Filobasidium floriforme]|uniref:acyl-CoA dehydrogenase/oxidase n=1 Tax=Filobasidium floriforme TaxID=5210 RepID=UPI001E8E86DB|nr:acyl-CoA dehydrogenase/oxidase [Filobasidium floriforme]KAH8080903.1 acyl-CoA dehydrogenase/oxidase [Filobasidium floriforme]
MLARTLRSNLPASSLPFRLAPAITPIFSRSLSTSSSSLPLSSHQSASKPANTSAYGRNFHVSAVRKSEVEEPNTRPEINTPPSIYNFTEEEEMLRETVRKFAQEVIGPKVTEMDESEVMDPEIIKGLFDQGLMGIETSAEHGGSEMSFMAAILAVEELSKVDPSVSVCCDVHNTLVNSTLRLFGNDYVKDKYLPGLATNVLGSFCLSEPNSGSDAFALQTTAKLEPDGEHYILNGSKMWITNSGEADYFLVFANIDPSKGYKGITCFMVEKDWGVQIAKKEKKLGIRASSTCLLSFDDVKVPAKNVVGEVGKGYKIAIEILNEGRIGIAAQMLGLAQGAFDYAVTYAFQRKQFGKPVGDNQGMGFQFAEVATEIETARLLTYNAARLKEEGKEFKIAAAMAKYHASKVAQKASGLAIEWCGGVGFTRDLPVQKFWRDSMIGAIYEGTSNIQLETIWKDLKKKYT